MTSFPTFTVSQQLKISVISNFIVISLFLNKLSSNLVYEVKIRSLFIFTAQKLRDKPFANYRGYQKSFEKLLTQKKDEKKIVCNKILKEKVVCTKTSYREFQHNNQEF